MPVLNPAPPTRAADPGHVAALDGVRALAILMVLGVHSANPFFPSPTRASHALHLAAGFGWMGVDLFFVLSGMLITGILLDTRGARGYYTSFYARRTLRIFPLHYLALAVFLLVVPAAAARLGSHAQLYPERPAWLWSYTVNVAIALHENWSAVTTPLTYTFWSLAVEEQFYLVWPFVVAALSPRALARAAAAMMVTALALRIALTLVGGHQEGLYVSTVTRMDALAAGALVALAARGPGGLARYRRHVLPVLVTCALGLAAIVAATRLNTNSNPLMQTVGFTLIAVGSAALLVAVLTAEPGARLRRVLEAPWARHVGARSYGVYVWHLAIIYGLGEAGLYARLAPAVPWTSLRGLVAVAVALGCALVAAELSWRCVEEPFLRLKRFVPRPQPAAAAAIGPAPVAAAEPRLESDVGRPRAA